MGKPPGFPVDCPSHHPRGFPGDPWRLHAEVLPRSEDLGLWSSAEARARPRWEETFKMQAGIGLILRDFFHGFSLGFANETQRVSMILMFLLRFPRVFHDFRAEIDTMRITLVNQRSASNGKYLAMIQRFGGDFEAPTRHGSTMHL